MKKRFVALLLCLVMVVGLIPAAMAAGPEGDRNYITFKANDGSYGSSSERLQQLTESDVAIGWVTLRANDFNRDGYTFLGWFDGDTKVEAIGADAVGNKYFKAHWEKIPVICSVTLDTDGGTINSGNVTSYTEGVGVTLPTDVTKVGYTFLGWFTAYIGGVQVRQIEATETGDKTFYLSLIHISEPTRPY